MSDARLRELGRARRATPWDVGGEAMWLVERLRMGAIDEDRLLLARVLGSPAARKAVTSSLDAPSLSYALDTIAAKLGLNRGACEPADRPAWKRCAVLACQAMAEVAARAHHLSARGRSPHYKRREVGPGWAVGSATCHDVSCDMHVRTSNAVRAWLLEDSASTRSACWQLSVLASRGLPVVAYDPAQGAPQAGLGDDLWISGPAAMASHEGGRPDLIPRVFQSCLQELMHPERIDPPGARRGLMVSLMPEVAEGHLREAVAKEVIPWCLA